jgi:Holliday junction DNA helicase RuvA
VYDYIEGQVAQRSAGRVVLDVGGVGYDIGTPLNALVPGAGRVRLWIHMVVREDAHQLIGFTEPASRDVFRALLTVSGVGPKVALAVMSGLERSELVEAIVAGDAARLTAVRGVGRKTAEQILLDLRQKALSLRADSPSVLPATARTKAVEDAVAALMSIGFTDKEARKQVERAAKSVDVSDLDQLVRAALAG